MTTVPPVPPASVLVVDDDEDVRALVALHLLMSGFTVREAATVDAGLTSLEALPPQVVLTDLNFGPDSGERIVRRCRERGLPVILMTASAETRELAKDLRSDLVILRKPFALDDVNASIATLLAAGDHHD